METRRGNEFEETDANGYTRKFIKGEEGELLSYVDSNGFEYNTEYNSDGLISAFANPDGSNTQISYDNEGQIRSILNPDGSEITFAYDSNDRVVRMQLCRSSTCALVITYLGLPESIHYKFYFVQITKNIGNDIISYQYNNDGRVNQASNSMGSVIITYDDRGGPEQISYPNGRTVHYGFNSDNQRSFTADSHGYNVSYQYNQKKQLIAVTYTSTGQPVVLFEYNSRGLLSRKTLGNGAFTTFTYIDDITDLSTITNYDTNGTLSSYYIYGYDVKGRIIQISTIEGNWTFGYDPAGQVIEWTNPDGDVTTYSYDGRSNRVVMTENGRESGYETNNVNQYISFNQSDRFSYDANGNLIRKIFRGRNESFQFDAEGKLIQTEVPGKRYVSTGINSIVNSL